MQALQASTNINIGYIAHGTHHYEIHGRILISFYYLVFTSLYFWSCCRGFVSRDRGETEAYVDVRDDSRIIQVKSEKQTLK